MRLTPFSGPSPAVVTAAAFVCCGIGLIVWTALTLHHAVDDLRSVATLIARAPSGSGAMIEAAQRYAELVPSTDVRRNFAILLAAFLLGSGFATLGLHRVWGANESAPSRQEVSQEILLHNERLSTALVNMSHGLAMFDSQRRLIVANPRYAELYKLPPELVRPGTPQPDILAYRVKAGTFATGDAAKQIQARVDNATAGAARDSIIELSDGRVLATSHRPMADGGWVSVHQDITDRRRAEAQIEHMARHDALTHLPNRVLFRERMGQELARTLRQGSALALLYFDLDRFKAVNDSLGHPIGDLLLQSVAQRVSECVRDTDVAARFGGDEFGILQVAIEQGDDPGLLASRIVQELSRPFDVDGHQVTIGVSVGIAVAPADGSDPDELLKKADLALYRAKAHGRGTYRFFEPGMDLQAQARRSLELDLRHALQNGEFEVFYQPLFNLKDDVITGFEALLRWFHPTRGDVPPSEFLPLTEELRLIIPIGAWVLRQACKDAMSWPPDMKVAVNVSPIQFKGDTLLHHVMCALAESGLSPARLELEITESVLLEDNAKNLATLHHLRNLGIKICMDDFGTGYSSLSYLRSFPFDKIKIDRSFVEDLSDAAESRAVLRAVAGLGSSLGITTTAEGVESREQLDKVRAEGCTEVQGFYFSPARPAAELAGLMGLSTRQKSAAA
jgi:diguanylate cyclase (GGDEF)-like protein